MKLHQLNLLVEAKGFKTFDLLVPNQVLKSHKRFIWRRLRDTGSCFPSP
jgi:hypothetical protein